MIFEAGANDLALVVEIFRADKTDHAIDDEGIESTRDTVCAGFQRQLIDAVVSFRGKRAALSRFEIHGLRALPCNVARAMVRENFLASFTQRRESDAEAAIGRFGAGDGLEEQVHRRAAIHRGKLSADVGEAANLRGHL